MTQGLRDLSILGIVSRDQHTLFSLLVVAEMPHLPGIPSLFALHPVPSCLAIVFTLIFMS